MLTRFAGAPEALARELDSVLENDSPRSATRLLLADALVQAANATSTRAHTALVREMLPLARRLLSRRRKTRAAIQLNLPNLEPTHGSP